MNWLPNPNAGHPPHGDCREFSVSHGGPMWQYTHRDGIFVTYGYGKTPEDAKADAMKDTPHD